MSKTVLINGDTNQTQAATLAELLRELGLHERRCATMVNGDVVKRDARDERGLSEGDKIEIIAMVGGG